MIQIKDAETLAREIGIEGDNYAVACGAFKSSIGNLLDWEGDCKDVDSLRNLIHQLFDKYVKK